jgi:hypothetical protein
MVSRTKQPTRVASVLECCEAMEKLLEDAGINAYVGHTTTGRGPVSVRVSCVNKSDLARIPAKILGRNVEAFHAGTLQPRFTYTGSSHGEDSVNP